MLRVSTARATHGTRWRIDRSIKYIEPDESRFVRISLIPLFLLFLFLECDSEQSREKSRRHDGKDDARHIVKRFEIKLQIKSSALIDVRCTAACITRWCMRTLTDASQLCGLLRFIVSWFLEPPHGINVSMVWWHRRYSILHMECIR